MTDETQNSLDESSFESISESSSSSSSSRFYTLMFFCFLFVLFIWHVWDFIYDKHIKQLVPLWITREKKQESSHFTDVEAGRRAAIRRKQEETAALATIAAEKQRVKDLEELERQAESIKLRSNNAQSLNQGGGQRLVEKSNSVASITPALPKASSTTSSAPVRREPTTPKDVPRIPKVIPLTESEIAAQRIQIASDRLEQMSSEPSIDAEGVITLAIRCISWRGELRDERRFLPVDTIDRVADFVQASGAFEADGGMRNAALYTVFPRKCLLDWRDYDLSLLTTKKDFETFTNTNNASDDDGGNRSNKNGHATLSELGLSGRTVLSLVRSNN
jgi:hypothetical protein